MVTTVTASGEELLDGVITKSYVYRLHEEGQAEIKAFPVRALWDTGSVCCLITPETAAKLGLKSLGKKKNNTAAGPIYSNVYEMGLVIDGKIEIKHAYACECYGGDRFDFVIGMSVIQLGNFSLYGKGKDITMVFSIER